jgi:hypothetical protein
MIDFKSDVTRQVVRGVCEGVAVWAVVMVMYWLVLPLF